MVTASHLIGQHIRSRPLLQEAIMEDIISFASLAEKLHPKIEKELGKKISLSAVVMALRRHAEKIKKEFRKKTRIDRDSEIIMKTNLIDLCFLKSPTIFSKINRIYKTIDYEKGDTFNMINGNYEISIVASAKYLEKIEEILSDEKRLNKMHGLVSITVNFKKGFLATPGIIFETSRKLAWENVNIIEIISTMRELTFIVAEKDSMRAYAALSDLMR